MKTFNHMSAERLRQLVERFPSLRVAVVGDFFLDKYLHVDPALAEVSIETGKTAHQVVTISHSPGAAGTVVCNLAALGTGTLHAVGFTGTDGEAYDLRQDLTRLSCTVDHLHADSERKTPTYLKPRNRTITDLSGEHERYDTKNRIPTSKLLENRICDSIDTLLPHVDALIVLDQVEEDQCGVITTQVRETLAERAPHFPKVVFWADSRMRINRFRHVLIKPNQFEAVGIENPPPGAEVTLDQLAQEVPQLRKTIGAPIFATCGPKGMVLSDPEMTLVPGVRLEGPTDPTGAGDSATAGCVLALAAGATPPEAALLGNLVASITVEQLATTGTARPSQLFKRLDLWLAQQTD